MKIFSKDLIEELLVAHLGDQHCHLQHFKLTDSGLKQLNAGELKYSDPDNLGEQFVKWYKSNSPKNCECRWVLGRDIYQTHQVESPNVLAKEMDEAIKWQIKDLLEHSIDQSIVTHYRPTHRDEQNQQIVAVASYKPLIEAIINATHSTDLTLASIDIEELTLGHALGDYVEQDKVVGFIGEDSAGLVFNFYNAGGLAFTRHKKGKFLPNSHQHEFSLEQDQEAEQESFLLETQRTLDYVVSNIFRRPIDKILLQENSKEDAKLADVIRQITELEVNLVSARVEQDNNELAMPSLAQVGAALQGSH